MKKGNAIALLPIGVFLCIYLGLGILFEYVMKIPMGFYNVPIIIAFLAAILVACLQNRKVSFDGKLEIMAQGLADKNIITMSNLPDSGGICRSGRKKQCGKCGIFHVVTDSGKIFSCGIICGSLFCVGCHGNVGWDNYIDHADRSVRIQGFGI